MADILDLRRQHKMIGPTDDEGQAWAIQDSTIFGWSESNVRFEKAWWLKLDGTPLTDHPNPGLVEAICRDRAFDPKWLK